MRGKVGPAGAAGASRELCSALCSPGDSARLPCYCVLTLLPRFFPIRRRRQRAS
ncbi:hypothetical protein BU14_2950s0001 [Porphyra umbilicalis]|uniref:Uncharacterized protein n=1 Tax=Porphyra umbilicalis TaxID=2786 RepID=A0A1X6NIA9_PORUM|nr:hypothetical protein BU14_2950s0001 [Porphyra umbilicalis]|eukprot:OSX68354.1 hypothetical protein BU14_2950s0001 [Porphyra umbilicalis]